jgi:hypothetical protein
MNEKPFGQREYVPPAPLPMIPAASHFAHNDKSQKAMYYRAHDKLAARNEAFMEMLNHPTNPLTAADLRRLIARHPDRYAIYGGFIDVLEKREA